MSGPYVPFGRLIERTNDEGELVLTGDFGPSVLVGRLGEPTANGNRVWLLSLTEADERAKDRRRRNRERKRLAELGPDIEELGGCD